MVLNLAPNSGGAAISGGNSYNSNGPAIWMSGDGPGADAAGNVYLLTGNGRFETTPDANGFPNQGDYGNSFVKIANNSGKLGVADYFAMSNEVTESGNDQDLGSGGELLLPDLTDSSQTVRHLVVGAGKDGNIYIVNRDSMGKFSASANNIWQEVDGVLSGGVWGSPAYFNGNLYYVGDAGGTLNCSRWPMQSFRVRPALSRAPSSLIPGLRLLFQPTVRRMASSPGGPTRTPAQRYFTPTMRPTLPMSCITASRQRGLTPAPVISSSRR